MSLIASIMASNVYWKPYVAKAKYMPPNLRAIIPIIKPVAVAKEEPTIMVAQGEMPINLDIKPEQYPPIAKKESWPKDQIPAREKSVSKFWARTAYIKIKINNPSVCKSL
jgi:hypothetical protein